MTSAGKTIRQRLRSLEDHLRKENPVLVDVVQSYRRLDDVARSLGLLDAEQSFATQISWWPMISVLGTFSAGKSTFINHFLGETLQETGNQAVDDKFTVICYGRKHGSRSIPGTALDADPRFPFYRISNELDKVAAGEGRKVDNYLQLKTSPCEKLRGSILIDSPGFDADSQRDATLRLTDHIIDLSDLVLVFFDARHPEPGAMRDTLAHLVGNTIHRADATKFVFILNQMDTTAREDNPEEVVGAWQRALAQEGLTAGRFYMVYNPDVAVPIDDERLRARYESRRDHDLAEIHRRIQGVGVERAYRITGALEKLANYIETTAVPEIAAYRAAWRKRVLWGDAALLVALVIILALLTRLPLLGDALTGLLRSEGGTGTFQAVLTTLLVVFLGGAFGWLHFRLRRFAAQRVARKIAQDHAPGPRLDRLKQAFLFNTGAWHSLFRTRPVGWGKRSRKRLRQVVAEANRHVQTLNDDFTDPSGSRRGAEQPSTGSDSIDS